MRSKRATGEFPDAPGALSDTTPALPVLARSAWRRSVQTKRPPRAYWRLRTFPTSWLTDDVACLMTQIALMLAPCRTRRGQLRAHRHGRLRDTRAALSNHSAQRIGLERLR